MANIIIGLAGNPNCGKTTVFNVLTGGHQRVGNWPGVTVERWEGHGISRVTPRLPSSISPGSMRSMSPRTAPRSTNRSLAPISSRAKPLCSSMSLMPPIWSAICT